MDIISKALGIKLCTKSVDMTISGNLYRDKC